MMASAATGGGTKIMVALAPVLRDGLGDGVEERKAFLGRAALAGRDAADELRAVVAALLGVERAGLADALADDARVLVDEDAHGIASSGCVFSGGHKCLGLMASTEFIPARA